MLVRLEVANQKANINKVVLKADTVIGRSTDCNLRIASNEVSRRHCRVIVTDDGVSVQDLGSSNGTFVNGQKIEQGKQAPLAPDSELSLGAVKFVVRYDLPTGTGDPGSTVEIPFDPAMLAAAEEEDSTQPIPENPVVETVPEESALRVKSEFPDGQQVEESESADTVQVEPKPEVVSPKRKKRVANPDETISDFAVNTEPIPEFTHPEPASGNNDTINLANFQEPEPETLIDEIQVDDVGEQTNEFEQIGDDRANEVEEPISEETTPKPSKLKSLFGLFKRKRPVEEPTAEADMAEVDEPEPSEEHFETINMSATEETVNEAISEETVGFDDSAEPTDDEPVEAESVDEDDVSNFLSGMDEAPEDEAASDDDALGDFLNHLS
jgi:hypothetical protein